LKRKQNFFYTFLTFLAVILALTMVLYPEATFKGANYGFKIWATVLIPALLPFFIIADILVELGFVNFFGILLEPLMRPIFKQPGAAGFVLAMGFTSGFPMGAVLTNTLYEKDLCTKEEASRLIAFTNNSSPLFLLVAVPIGMFNNPKLGILLAVTHYGANIILGILLGLKKQQQFMLSFKKKQENLLKRSFLELIKAQQKNQKPLATLLGSAINKSIQNMLSIGGFVIFFAVLIEILRTTNIIIFLNILFCKILHVTGINHSLAEALSTGLFEMTLGTKKASEINASFIHQAMIVSLILGWSGLSIQAQVSSFAGKHKIPIHYYLIGRVFQGLVACILTGLLFSSLLNALPAMNIHTIIQPSIGVWNYFIINAVAFLITILTLLVISIMLYIFNQLKRAF